MKLYLAVAVLMLAFAALTDAEEVDTTIQDRFTDFGTQISQGAQDIAEKTKQAFQDFHESEFVLNTKSWFERQFDKVKASIGTVN
ncbi:apolipoprotein C-I [Polymixia lowei]